MYKMECFSCGRDVADFLNKNQQYDVVSMAISNRFIYVLLKEKTV